MEHVFKDTAVIDGNPQHSLTVYTEKFRTFTVQMVSKPATTAEASAVCVLEGSNNKEQWINIATLRTHSEAGTIENPPIDSVDGGTFKALWVYMRFRLLSTVNCTVNLYADNGYD